jgi:NADPH:quinone reductase
MKAVRVHRFGEPLQVDDVPEPQPGPGEVVVQLEYVGVNPLDIWVTRGTVAGGRQPLPFVPGVEAVGSVDGRRFLVRLPGAGSARDGCYRERLASPSSELLPVPEGVDPAQAAAMPVAGATAWRLVNDVTSVGPEDRVVVLGASGGVGSLAVQLAKARGAVVWGQTGNAQKAAGIRSHGADRAIVAGAEDLAGQLAELQPTVVLDPLGGQFTSAGVEALATRGRLALFGTSVSPEGTLDLRGLYRKEAQILSYSGTIEPPERVAEATQAALRELAAGHIRMPIDEVLPLERAADAHRRILERRVQGKLLLRP